MCAAVHQEAPGGYSRSRRHFQGLGELLGAPAIHRRAQEMCRELSSASQGPSAALRLISTPRMVRCLWFRPPVGATQSRCPSQLRQLEWKEGGGRKGWRDGCKSRGWDAGGAWVRMQDRRGDTREILEPQPQRGCGGQDHTAQPLGGDVGARITQSSPLEGMWGKDHMAQPLGALSSHQW